MRRKWILRLSVLVIVLVSVLSYAVPTAAADTVDITVTATPAWVSIACDQPTYDFGTVAESATPSTATNWATITNTSTIQTDQTISVTTAVWDGDSEGVDWTHSDTATPGVLTAGLKANRGGTWDTGDIIVKNTSPEYIYENCPATTNYSFGLKLLAPTDFTGEDGSEKTITVRISAVAG